MKPYATLAILVVALVLAGPLLPVHPAAAGALPDVAAPPSPVSLDFGRLPLYFVANQGQLDTPVAYYVQGHDKTLYFTPQGVTFALAWPQRGVGGFLSRLWGAARWTVRLDFLGANAVHPRGQEKTEAVISYFKGAPDQWRAGLPTYSRIVYPELWAGIDLAYSGTTDRLKYEFVVQPGADPSQIRLAYRGAAVRLDQAGRLEVRTPAGRFTDDVPVAYQEVDGQRVPVAVAYALADGAMWGAGEGAWGAGGAGAGAGAGGAGEPRPYGFRVGAYDPALPLIIDPAVLVYCGYIGGSGWDDIYGVAVDAAGYLYVTGRTDSAAATFPATVGPDLTANGSVDAFVAKVRADGTGLVYCGYIGGAEDDVGIGVAVDAAGHAYVVGETASHETDGFPVLVGPDLTHNSLPYQGAFDAFVARVKPDGTGLDYCGYIGGAMSETGISIAVDAAGRAYVAGYTVSSEARFPVTVGPDLTHNGSKDGFVARVRADGTGLEYCGYFGGTDYDEIFGLAVDTAGNAYITGRTASSQTEGFPLVVGPDLTFNYGNNDIFVAKVQADGTGLVYSGYIGGSGKYDEYGRGIAVDADGNAYVTGYTYSKETNSFPVRVGPDLTFNGMSGPDAFVAKVKADGTGLDYCGYIGGSGEDHAYGIGVDAAGNAYVVGDTTSDETEGFPLLAGPDLTFNGFWDAFVARVKADGTALDYCGYIGGDDGDYGNAIAVDAAGNAYVAGFVASSEATFPATVGPDLTFNGDIDAFVAKVRFFAPTAWVFLPVVVK